MEERFQKLIDKALKKERGVKVKRRSILERYGDMKRRTSSNVWRINEELGRHGLHVKPSLQVGKMDGYVRILATEKARITNDPAANAGNFEFDPITRLAELNASETAPVSVHPDDELSKATYLMWHHNYSQLPVMLNHKKITGIIDWECIAKALLINHKAAKVSDVMNPEFTLLELDMPLFQAIREIITHRVVFVQEKDRTIKGPVTAHDINLEYLDQIAPFIHLEEIENMLRMLLDGKFEMKFLATCANYQEHDRQPTSLSDLNFSDYTFILGDETVWERLSLPFHKKTFVADLDRIRQIRNNVVHFRPGSLAGVDLELLENTSQCLQEICLMQKNCEPAIKK
ncbi:MAG: CBS domain-containing protein [Nonlabens sp.]